MKTCSKCLQSLPLENFHRNVSSPDGRRSDCIICKRAFNKRRYEEEPERYAGYYRNSMARPEVRAKKRAASHLQYLAEKEKRQVRQATRRKADPAHFKRMEAESRARHPERHAARCILARAVRKGIVIRKPCAVCGNPKSQGHHDDYSKPLEVIWLCSKHHGFAHRTI